MNNTDIETNKNDYFILMTIYTVIIVSTIFYIAQ